MAFDLPRVVGHRGAAAYAPENTLEGLGEAARRGAGGAEFDAKLTGDGVVVLMHDETLDRTTNGCGPLARTVYADVCRLDAGVWFGPSWRGARVPTLEQALTLLIELELQANVEIKPCPGREIETASAVVETIRRVWPPGKAWPLLSSFSRESLAAAQAAAPEQPRGLLIWEDRADWAAAAEALACVAIHCSDQHLTPAWAAAVRGAGYGLAAYTVNEPARAVELVGWGVQCIISDRPDAIAAAI